jgi:hypothetical protein
MLLEIIISFTDLVFFTDLVLPLQDYEKEYFGYISNSTPRTYNLNPEKPPKVYDYKTCVEVDSQFFYSGVPWDMTARNYSALTINLAFNTSLTAHDVIAV